MSHGARNGELIEVRWSSGLEGELSRWIASDAQFPALAAGAMADPAAVSRVMVERADRTSRAVRVLADILKRHAVKSLDAEVIEVSAKLLGAARGEPALDGLPEKGKGKH